MLVLNIQCLVYYNNKGSVVLETNVEEQKQMDYDRLAGKSGLGGWLILVQIGLYGSLIMLLFSIIASIPTFSADVWEVLTSIGSEYYHPLWGPLIISETIINILMFIFCIYIMVKFYGKKSILPRLMIIFYSVSLIIVIVDYILLLQIPLARELDGGSTIRDIVRSILTCAIWSAYFTQSDRVMNTFVK